MPAKLRNWKPKEKSSLPPSMGFCEREAAKAWGYKWPDWQVEGMLARADMMAHEWERSIREAYLVEEAKKVGNKPKNPTMNAFTAMKRMRGI